jgi:hypothetical protein
MRLVLQFLCLCYHSCRWTARELYLETAVDPALPCLSQSVPLVVVAVRQSCSFLPAPEPSFLGVLFAALSVRYWCYLK